MEYRIVLEIPRTKNEMELKLNSFSVLTEEYWRFTQHFRIENINFWDSPKHKIFIEI